MEELTRGEFAVIGLACLGTLFAFVLALGGLDGWALRRGLYREEEFPDYPEAEGTELDPTTAGRM